MNTYIRKILAVCMVAILMLSTTSFSVYKHFCGGNLVDVSNYETVDDCCDVVIKSSKTDSLNFSAEDCCKNESAEKEPLHFDSNEVVKIKKSQVIFIASFYSTFIKKATKLTTSNKFYANLLLPKITQNRQVLFQSFLI
ncbi:hypothetical protein SAMN05444411_10635 [Lutibacter oricola]|uniref:Transmembrane protein n=1 Tax=Lutibacter oricola TaxID=762486 RepID=A0A1H3C3P8_9FLAO|nr:hypothetical protein [Lutibacter oricola]SDX48528.1 hypothetical protein SAMN05444411_10635 [Lutibacter oricola]